MSTKTKHKTWLTDRRPLLMTNFETFIIDDEKDAGLLLQNLLVEFSPVLIKGVFTDALIALDRAVTEQPDVVFLDITMPEITGMEFLQQLSKFSPQTKVVFVSAYKKYALEALQNGAFDFIPKPVGTDDLRRVVHKLIAAGKSNGRLEETGSHLLLKTNEGHHYVAADKILYMEAEGNYTHLVLTEDKKLFSAVNLGRIYEQLPQDQFVRISRKHIINKSYLTFMNFCKKLCIVSANGKEFQLEVSIKLKDLKQHL